MPVSHVEVRTNLILLLGASMNGSSSVALYAASNVLEKLASDKTPTVVDLTTIVCVTEVPSEVSVITKLDTSSTDCPNVFAITLANKSS